MYQSADLRTPKNQELISSLGIGAFAQVARSEVAGWQLPSPGVSLQFRFY